jgi:hypothetical protein
LQQHDLSTRGINAHLQITMQYLPPHLQTYIFVLSAAPLTTCKATAAIAKDVSLTAQWLVHKHQQPLTAAIQGRLWGVCEELLARLQYKPDPVELNDGLLKAAKAGQTGFLGLLLQQCCKEPHRQQCGTCAAMRHALFVAATGGHLPACSLLVKHPANTAQDVQCVVACVAREGQVEVLRMLLTEFSDATSQHVDLRQNSNFRMFLGALSQTLCYGNTEAMNQLMQVISEIHPGWAGAEGTQNLLRDGLRYAAANGQTAMLPCLSRWLQQVE